MSASSYMLPSQAGTRRLSRFELIHIVSMIILRGKQRGLADISPLEARRMVLEGESPLFVQRSYTDGSTARFRILPGGLLEGLPGGLEQ